MIEIGRILKPHGIQGQLKVRLYSDNFEGFATRGFAYVPKGGSTWRMEYDVVRIDPPFIYLFADGVTTRNQAEELRNLPLLLNRSDLEEPGEGEHYIVDLIGLNVVDENGEKLGVLKDVLQYGAADVYVVQGKRGFIFPAVKRVITAVDLEAGEMRVDSRALSEVAVYDDI
jgi:16S rRNA processing protein RimM